MSFTHVVRGVALFIAGLTLALALGAGRAEARWLRAETRHFVLYSDGMESGLRRYAADLEAFDRVLRTAHGLDPDAPVARKLDIYVVDGPHELARVFPDRGKYIAGVYRANLGDIYAVAVRPQVGAPMGNRFLFHEYSHHFMLQYFPARYPAWVVEGYAEYFGMTRIEEDRIEVGLAAPDRVRRLVEAKWPIADVLGDKLAMNEPEERGRFYALSWLMTHYLLSDPVRKTKFDDYLARVGRGEDAISALPAALGVDLATFEQQLKDYLRATPAIRYARDARPDLSVAITTLSPSADALLLEGQRLKSGVKAEERAELLALVRDRAARFPGDRLADLTLARAEITYGDRAAGEAILTRRIEADSRDAEALWLMALSKIFAGQADRPRRAELYAQARPYLGKAFAVDGERYQTLFDYAQARSLDADYPSENVMAVLLKAHSLAPQVAPVRVQTARALMRRKRFPEAIALLTPLANDPHDGPMSTMAERMIEGARRGEAPAPTPDGESGADKTGD